MDERDDTTLAEPGAAAERGPGYRKITEALIADIRAGRWSVSGKLPTEAELVDRFGASRNTIRESLRELETFGYIKRRRGTRSILLSADPSESFVNSVRSIEEMMQYSRRTASRLLSSELIVATGALVERLGVERGSQWQRLQVLRLPLRGSLPIGFSEIYVDPRYADIGERMGPDLTVYRTLEEDYGVTFRRVEQTIGAAAAASPVAELLRVKPGTPLLTVRTDFVTSAGDVAEIGFGHFPADRYKIEFFLERGQSGAEA